MGLAIPRTAHTDRLNAPPMDTITLLRTISSLKRNKAIKSDENLEPMRTHIRCLVRGTGMDIAQLFRDHGNEVAEREINKMLYEMLNDFRKILIAFDGQHETEC